MTTVPTEKETWRLGSSGRVVLGKMGEKIATLPNDENVRAHGRLIAAAPDLLAACLQVQADLGDRLTGKTVLMLRAAIAKAEPK